MRENFDKIISYVLTFEGGYVNDPDDPGGETNLGISKKAFPDEDIKNLTVARAKELYHAKYWNAVHGDDLPAGMDACVVDFAVNAGVTRALAMLQEAKDPDDYLFRRIQYYLDISKKNPTLKKFLWGWITRVLQLRRLINA